MNLLQKINQKGKLFEESLLQKICLNENQAIIASTLLRPDELNFLRTEFELILDCHKNKKGLAEEFISKGLSLSGFMGAYIQRDTESICRDIREVSNARKLYFLLEEGTKNVPLSEVYEYVSDLQKKITTTINKSETEKTDSKSLIQEFRQKQNDYKERFKNGQKLIGNSTGFDNLDAVIDGLREEHLWVIGGYTNTGKTAASLNITAELIRQQKHVVYYSFEMGRTDILSRLAGIMTGQSGTAILKNFPHNEKQVEESFKKIESSDFSVHSFKSELSELLFSILEENTKKHVDLFVIDFIQLVTIKGSKSEYETITNSILELQKAAKRFKCTIMVLSQISNDGAKNGDSPVMSFKGSGAIAAAADLAIEIKSGEDSLEELKGKIMLGQNVRMKWDVRKNRHGRVGTMDMTFNGATGIFKREDKEF